MIQGKLSHLVAEQKTEALINQITEEAVKTSEIESEYNNRPDVRSSLKNKLGLTHLPIKVHDKRAQGIADLVLSVRNTFDASLTDTQLFDWHLMLLSGSYKYACGLLAY